MWATPGSRLLVPLVLRLTRIPARLSPGIARRVQSWVDQRMRLHKALEGISLDLPRGHALGIVGLNGSGKSTLLQIIAGVLQPSTSSVEVRGRIAALLELGSGFNPEMTGRENVILNAAVLGMPRARAEALMERILAFADIGEYVDQPVKTYSSGMVVRLGFAVQVHMEPDILIVDEALAVGDAEFQARAMARIDEILSTGTTLLFVGHDLNAIRAFCREAMLLEKGRIVMRGSPEDVTPNISIASIRKVCANASLPKPRQPRWPASIMVTAPATPAWWLPASTMHHVTSACDSTPRFWCGCASG